jgi:hypothetical protein
MRRPVGGQKALKKQQAGKRVQPKNLQAKFNPIVNRHTVCEIRANAKKNYFYARLIFGGRLRLILP